MAKGYNSYLTIYENDGWFDTGTSSPIVPVVESESLDVGLITNERTSMVRSTRAQLEDNLVYTQEYKPEGALEIVPRMETLPSLLMSHFQIVDEVATGSSYINTYVPLKTTPQYLGNDIYGAGAYGATADDVFSIDIKRNMIGTNSSSTDDTVWFQRGVCDKLSFSMQPNEDFKVKADMKFKGVDFLNANSGFGDAGVGSYTTGTLSDWSHGTWQVSFSTGTFTEVSGVTVECSNNLIENKTLGALNRTTFNFGNYTVKGNFSLEYTDDEWYEQWQNNAFDVRGTIWHTDTEYLAISMPRCFIKPFNKTMVKPEQFIDAEVEFEAYEYQGTSPVTVTLHTTVTTPDIDVTYWDASMGARTLAQYDFGDAGSTTRTLSQYDFADRDV